MTINNGDNSLILTETQIILIPAFEDYLVDYLLKENAEL